MRELILRFLRDDFAATSIEYALIAGGVSIVIVGVVNTIGTQLNTVLYGQLATALKSDPERRRQRLTITRVTQPRSRLCDVCFGSFAAYQSSVTTDLCPLLIQ